MKNGTNQLPTPKRTMPISTALEMLVLSGYEVGSGKVNGVRHLTWRRGENGQERGSVDLWRDGTSYRTQACVIEYLCDPIYTALDE